LQTQRTWSTLEIAPVWGKPFGIAEAAPGVRAETAAQAAAPITTVFKFILCLLEHGSRKKRRRFRQVSNPFEI
jgi:hypothetical protein